MPSKVTTTNVTCVQCGKDFHVIPSRLGKAKLCGQVCATAWKKANPNGGQFQKGQPSPRLGKVGVHNSPETEFKPGHRRNHEWPVGTVKRRCHSRAERNYIKSSEGWVHYAVWLWEQEYGPVIPGDTVHHMNGDRFDDRLENLIALPRTDHPRYHGRWGCKTIPPEEIERYKARYDGRKLGTVA